MLYALLLIATIAADQWLKYWTVSNLEFGQSTPFIPGVMQLTRLHNYGAAWSSLSGKTVLLIAVTAVLLIGVTVLLVKRIVRHPLGMFSCILILGGGIGNMIDRVVHGYVVDMFDLLLFSYPIGCPAGGYQPQRGGTAAGRWLRDLRREGTEQKPSYGWPRGAGGFPTRSSGNRGRGPEYPAGCRL